MRCKNARTVIAWVAQGATLHQVLLYGNFEAGWTRFSGLSKAGNLWVRYSPKLRREVRFTRDVDYWHWLLIEIDPEISAFCEEPVPRNHVGAKMAALADVWLMRTDGAIEFRSIARLDKQVSTTARVLQETFGEGFTHRALSKEEVLSEPFLLDNSLRMVGFLSPSGPEISMDLLSSIEEAFRSSGTQMLGEAIDRLTPLHHEQQILVALIALIHRGRLKANLREGLTEKTNLRWENRGNATIAS
jgi:hypothetical protein